MWMMLVLLFFGHAEEVCTTGDVYDREACLRRKLAELQQQEAIDSRSPEEKEKAAAKLLTEAMEASGNGDVQLAKKKLKEIEMYYSDTRTMRRANRVRKEIEVIGAKMPMLNQVEWIQGYESTTAAQSGTAILVFWEVWCPHSKREVPELNNTLMEYGPKGLKVIAFTKLSRGKTEEDVKSFLDERDIRMSVGKEDGGLSTTFNVSGIPAAALVHDGVVVWRGHPAKLTDEMLENYLF